MEKPAVNPLYINIKTYIIQVTYDVVSKRLILNFDWDSVSASYVKGEA